MLNHSGEGIEFPWDGGGSIQEWWETATPDDVENLVKSGADVNARDRRWGYPPLLWAACHNPYPEVIEALRNAGAVPCTARRRCR